MSIKTRPARDARGRTFTAAICSACARDASQCRISRYCEYAMNWKPLKCDDCHELCQGDGK